NFEESISSYKYALKHSRILEDAVSSLNEIANCFVDTNRKDEALELYRHMLRIAPHAAAGYYGYIASNTALDADDSVKLSIIKLLETGGLGQAKRMNLHYALGKVYDASKEYGEAFAHFVIANSLRSNSLQSRRASRKFAGEGVHTSECVESRAKVFTKE